MNIVQVKLILMLRSPPVYVSIIFNMQWNQQPGHVILKSPILRMQKLLLEKVYVPDININ